MLKTRIKYKKNVITAKIKSNFGVRPKKIKAIDVSILCYHGIIDNHPEKYNSRFITANEFEQHLNFLNEQKDIVVISLTDLVNNKLIPNKLNVVLTFDDGYLNNLNIAIPLINKYSFHATFCINNVDRKPLWTDVFDILCFHYPETEIDLDRTYKIGAESALLKRKLLAGNSQLIEKYLSATDHLWSQFIAKGIDHQYWKRMDEDDLGELASNEHYQLIPHGSKHLNLCSLDASEKVKEITESISLIESLTNKSPNIYCPAFGFYDKLTVQSIYSSGIENILGVDRNQNGYLHRLVIHPHINFEYLKYFIYKGTFT